MVNFIMSPDSGTANLPIINKKINNFSILNNKYFNYFFIILNPLLAFGGILGYPSIIISTLLCKFKLAFFFTMIEVICRYIKNLEDSQIILYLNKGYIKSISGIKKNITYINRNQPSSEREIIFLIPHGAVCSASCVLLTTFVKENKIKSPCILVVDNTLATTSTMFKAICNIAGVKTIGITDKKICKELKQKKSSLAVNPGGFVEAISVTETKYGYYTNTYKYWIRRAIEYDYNIRIIFSLNGANFYPQSDYMIKTRIKIAKLSIPMIHPSIPNSPKLLVNDWYYNIKDIETTLDKYERIDKIYDIICYDIENKYNEHKTGNCPKEISKID